MMNAAMLIAPAASSGDMPSAGKATEGQGHFFGRALAQQEHRQMVSQGSEHQQQGQMMMAGNLAFVNRFSELFEQEVKPLFDLQPDQQDLIDQADIDTDLLSRLILMMEHGMVPDSMEQADLQQLIDLVDDVTTVPELWQQQVVTEDSESQAPASEQGHTPEQQIEKLAALFNQYFTEQAVNKEAQSGSDRPQQQVEQSLTAAQTLEQLRARVQQMRGAMQQAGLKDDQVPVNKAAIANKGVEVPSADARMIDAPVKVNGEEVTKSPLESRFSDLLKPRQQYAAQSRIVEPPGQYSQQSQQPPATTPSEEAVLTKVTEKVEVPLALHNVATAAKPPVDGGGQQQNHLHVQQPPVAATQAISVPTPVAAPFAGSQQVPDSQIFDQVVTHLSGSSRGESGRMVLRLHPAELGALRIELMVEGDRVRANLHAQTQQVQEVLERNLGQLRSALAEQGLKVDHFQVSSDARQNQHQGQAQDLARQRAEAELLAEAERSAQEEMPEDQHIPLEHFVQNGGRGISLRV